MIHGELLLFTYICNSGFPRIFPRIMFFFIQVSIFYGIVPTSHTILHWNLCMMVEKYSQSLHSRGLCKKAYFEYNYTKKVSIF